ncbi:NEW3 domain-containing protein [Methanocella conradii]|uniref:COG1470 family protein n=1 Tax=Methanocella conradii TaxID=1175444 RepID=UPI0024B373CD|nr:NEW3 domain-containing protein [Methanocella conradii]MDI6897235.1 NEW3 domain-containing protein [Methanocella conradii]
MSARTVSALLAIFLLAGAWAAPALAESYEPVYSGQVENGYTVESNGLFVSFRIVNGSLTAHVSGPDYPSEDANISAGHTYYYDSILRVYVDSINGSRAFVSVEKASRSTGGTSVRCDVPGQTALGGDVVSFPIIIQNNDESDHVYTLESYNDIGWKTWFEYENKGVYKISVPASQPRTVNLMVQTWSNTPVGEKKVWAYVGDIRVEVFVDITSANKTADVSAKVTSKIAYIGDRISYDMSIHNLQAGENHYKLAVAGLPDNWYARFKESASSAEEVDEVVVPASSVKDLVLEVVPPYSVAPGDYNFTAVVTGPDGLNVYRNLTLTLKSSGGMSVTASRLAYNARPGETFKIDLYVSNGGQGAALTNVYVETTAPEGWMVQASPEKVNSIKAGGSQVFTLSIQPPGNIVASDYEVIAKVKCDQAESQKDFRITVQTESYIPYIGGAIIVVVAAGLFLIYRKYGRR